MKEQADGGPLCSSTPARSPVAPVGSKKNQKQQAQKGAGCPPEPWGSVGGEPTERAHAGEKPGCLISSQAHNDLCVSPACQPLPTSADYRSGAGGLGGGAGPARPTERKPRTRPGCRAPEACRADSPRRWCPLLAAFCHIRNSIKEGRKKVPRCVCTHPPPNRRNCIRSPPPNAKAKQTCCNPRTAFRDASSVSRCAFPGTRAGTGGEGEGLS